jgi:ankyrin repeat protein
MSQKRQAQVPDVELQQECREDEESTNKRARGAEGNDQQQQDPGLDLDCKDSMNLPPPPQDDDPIITQFRPVEGQWELNDDNIKRIDPKNSQSLLHNYCQHINTTPLAVYRYLIEVKGCEVNVQDNNKDTPVHLAFGRFDPRDGGKITVLMYLLSQKGVNVNTKGQCGDTLLHYACKKINDLSLDIFKLLIETLGGDINVQSNSNNTPLRKAFRHFNLYDGYSEDDNIDILIYLLTQKNLNVNIQDKNGHSLLHYACKKINILPLNVFQHLIETLGGNFNPNGSKITVLTYLLTRKGINVNIKGKYDYTLLHLVCQYINKLPLDVFQYLIETLGCDMNAKDYSRSTPIHRALECFKPDDGDNINVLSYLINQHNVNVKIGAEDGNNLLHLACDNINSLPLEIFKLLIETVGCDVNAQNNDKDTPIHRAFACFNPRYGGKIIVLMYLLGHENVNANIRDKYGDNLLHYACREINLLPLEIFKCLIETHGADVNAQNDGKDTPLHSAFQQFDPNAAGDIAVLTYLLSQKGIDGNIKDKYGDTLLQRACKSINILPLEIFQNLIETVGCDVNVQDNSNDTPLHNALLNFDSNKGGDTKALAYLIDQKNVNLNLKGKKGLNLLHLTCINNLAETRGSVGRNAQCDTVLCRIVEVIAERCIKQVLDETTTP